MCAVASIPMSFQKPEPCPWDLVAPPGVGSSRPKGQSCPLLVGSELQPQKPKIPRRRRRNDKMKAPATMAKVMMLTPNPIGTIRGR